MAGLAIEYSKQVASELSKIAIFPPGQEVALGDIIAFPFGRTSIFKRPRPWGSFDIRSNVRELGINPGAPTSDPDPDPYIFASKRSAQVNFAADAQGGGANAPVRGTLTCEFRKENAIYFAAIDCATTRLTMLNDIERGLAKVRNQLPWDDLYLVESITVAARSLVMQSSTSGGTLDVKGEVKGLLPGSQRGDISANADVMVSSFRSAALIKPWSDNVTTFFSLAKLEKRTRDDADRRFEAARLARATPRDHSLVVDGDDEYQLVPVAPGDYVPDEDPET